MWQQVESFKNGLYAGAAFKRLIKERSIEETKFWLALDGWSYQVPDTKQTEQIPGWKEMSPTERREKWEEDLADQNGEIFDRRRWLDRRGEEIFEGLQQAQLPEARRYPHLEAMSDLAGFESDWDPPHNRMTMVRHETSRSRGARLIDNVFQRVKKTVNEGNNERLRR